MCSSKCLLVVENLSTNLLLQFGTQVRIQTTTAIRKNLGDIDWNFVIRDLQLQFVPGICSTHWIDLNERVLD